MSHVAFFLALPFGLALAAAAALRLAGGGDIGARLSGVAVPAGFLAGWTWLHGLTLVPTGLTGVAAHIALGGALAGLALDAAAARPGWRMIVGAAFVAAGVWAATGLSGAITPMPADSAGRAVLWVSVVVLAVAWIGTLLRLRSHSLPGTGGDTGAEGAALLAALAAGLGLTAAAVGATGIAAPAAGLATAALGFLALAAPLRLPFSGGAVLGGGGALLGLVQALAIDWPGTVIPLLILSLGLFAGGTVAHLPVAPRWRPLALLGLGLLPGLLAAATALALRG